jgi:hypothetical protein
MAVGYYHAECGGQLSDTKLHSRGKSLWQCPGCGFIGVPYKDINIEEEDEGDLSPVRIEMEDATIYFLHLLDPRERRVFFKTVEDEKKDRMN